MTNSYINRSNDYMKSIGITPYDFLPELSFDQGKIRSTKEVIVRLTILCLLVEVAFGRLNNIVVMQYLVKYNLSKYLSQKEIDFLKTDDNELKINETWKVECSCVFFWYLGILQEIPSPLELFDISSVKDYPITSLNTSPDEFIYKNFKFRKKTEVFPLLDLYSRLDYYCDMAKVNQFETNINSAAVYERRYALEWLASFVSPTWDDVSCDSIY